MKSEETWGKYGQWSCLPQAMHHSLYVVIISLQSTARYLHRVRSLGDCYNNRIVLRSYVERHSHAYARHLKTVRDISTYSVSSVGNNSNSNNNVQQQLHTLVHYNHSSSFVSRLSDSHVTLHDVEGYSIRRIQWPVFRPTEFSRIQIDFSPEVTWVRQKSSNLWLHR